MSLAVRAKKNDPPGDAIQWEREREKHTAAIKRGCLPLVLDFQVSAARTKNVGRTYILGNFASHSSTTVDATQAQRGPSTPTSFDGWGACVRACARK